jgi:hypothetical protein
MKTKLMALVLLAGGSLFAQTRLSSGAGNNRSYHPQPAPSYSGYQVAARTEQRSFDNRDNDAYARQSYISGFEQNRNRGFAQDRNRSGGFDQDGDRDYRSQGYEQNIRQGSFYSNGVRGH